MIERHVCSITLEMYLHQRRTNFRQEMAKFLWERCDEAIPSAIIASKIYLTLSEMIANYDSDAKAMYLKNKE